MQVVDFVGDAKWLQKGSFVQQDSNLCHDPLIPNQSNWGERRSVSGAWENGVWEKPVLAPVPRGQD
jgi:hypothetical protein